MKKLLISTALFTAPFAGMVSAQANTSSLNQLVSEQERQIKELTVENASLRSQLNLAQRNYGSQNVTVSSQTVSNSESSATSHTVKAGDTFSGISRKYGVSVSSLIAANPSVKPTKIAINQKLVIPQANSKVASQPTQPTPPKASVVSSSSQPISSGASSYKIAQGDTFYSIARKHNITLASLTAANPGVNPGKLKIGQTIRLNGSAPQPSQSAPAAPVKRSTKAYEPLPEVVKQTPAPKPAPAPVAKSTPAPEPAPAESPSYVKQSGDEVRTVPVSHEMTFGAFAKQHGTTIAVLNALNGLELPADEPMAAGSELYVPNK